MFDVPDRVVADAGLLGDADARIDRDGDVAGEVGGVVARAAVDDVVAEPAVQQIVADLAADDVVAGVAVDRVVAVAAVDLVVAVAAVDLVVAVLAVDEVRTGAAAYADRKSTRLNSSH